MAESTTTLFPEKQANVEFLNEGYDEESEKLSQECKELLLSLPRERGWAVPSLYLYKEVWYGGARVQAINSFRSHFQAKDNDIILVSPPKSGTTWLKALTFALVNRKRFSSSDNTHPLHISNAHNLVPYFEFNLYGNNHIPDLSSLSEPRLFSTHFPFNSFPDSITKSECKIIYICRNLYDTFVSLWFFTSKFRPPSLPQLSLEEAFERYCKGIHEFGPIWAHILGYWRESKEAPNKFLFLKYEELTGDTKFHLKRMAEFLGCPFDLEEEGNGVIENIIELCGFEKMKGLVANKTGKFVQKVEYKDFFRKGKVGDWVNHLSPWMEEKLSKVIEEKFGGSGLSFQ
ncbi:cytosolic sulfotransferase 15-like [Neltuma alba]|uniref:cytosolic sulfotransferase 15-like n=1 Tax=Neltuma alba TaxID=207710 RepID=UPI0010A3DC2A|nr:cytosolic sulfotransferase 15-like [Prosopis alba]